MKTPDVVFSAMRPTGRLHLGNYWGALKNWIALTQDYKCYFSVADWHMLTTGYGDTSRLQENSREMVLDWLAAGLDPEKCVIFKQSAVPEHAELALMLSMVTPLSSLENNPTWKEQLQELSKTKLSRLSDLPGEIAAGSADKAHALGAVAQETSKYELRTYGFLGYPVLQAADILLYRGAKVPVGQDQLPHLELSREIARKFNNAFGPVFPEPQPLLTPTPRVPGLDARKMSKSYDNAVDLLETPESLKTKVGLMYTDPKKIRANDPGHPEGCVVFALHRLYGTPDFVAKREVECREGKLGCMSCKKDLLAEFEPPFENFRKNRRLYESNPKLVDHILEEGARKARAVAQKTMEDVRRAMRLV